eukprot:10999546-Lingulodinium_polyedra.AAC.1
MGCVPLHADPEVVVPHRRGRFVVLSGKHVDDIEIAEELPVIREFLALLERAFGQLKASWNEFTNCRIRR